VSRSFFLFAAWTCLTAPVAAQSGFSTPAADAAERVPQTHWEPYLRNWTTPPSVDQHLEDRILDGVIDLHAHHGPDSYPRQWDAFEVAAIAAERGLRAIVIKNHWTETAGLAYLIRKYGAQGIEVFGSLTLATGHETPAEALMILAEARRLGIDKLIVTHPLLGEQYTNMSDAELQAAVDLGGVVEMTANTLYGAGPAKEHAFSVIRALGTGNVFVGSDSGLIGTPNHPDALVMAARELRAAGFSEHDLDLMFKINPARLIGLGDE
jgi:hypothetical protein